METLNKLKITIRVLAEQIEDFLSVETKDAEVVPFILNNKQKQLVEEVEKAKEPIRIIILKGRQFGYSTFIIAYFFVKCLVVPNTRAVVISHTEDATKKLFRKVKFFSSRLICEPMLDKESEKEFSFKKTNSYFYIGTAGTKTFGRGDNITDLHCSEVAMWENAGTIMNGLLQAVGKTGSIFIESTANGFGNYFNRIWHKSYKKTTASWTALFFSWVDFKEYELDVQDNFVLTDYEQEIKARYKLNDKQLSWRRWKIGETETDAGLTPEDIFKQEYPFTAEEAFIASGNTFFNKERIIELLDTVKEPIQQGDITLNDDLDFEFNDNSNGYTKIFELPDRYSSYIIGGDVAEGKEGGDYSVLNIIHSRTMRTVATYKARIRPDELANVAYALGKWYNFAYLGIEANTGLWVLTELYNKGYPNLYYREEIDSISHKISPKLGFLTSEKTRKPLLDNLLSIVNKFNDIWTNEEFLRECLVFIRNERGRPEASQGENDDVVIATAISYMIRDTAPVAPEIDEDIPQTGRELVKMRLRHLYKDKQTKITQDDYV